MVKPAIIVILDDDAARIQAMTSRVSNGLPGFQVVTFDSAPDTDRCRSQIVFSFT